MSYLARPITNGLFLSASVGLLGASIVEMKTILSKVEGLNQKIDGQQHARYGGRTMSGPGGVEFVLRDQHKEGIEK